MEAQRDQNARDAEAHEEEYRRRMETRIPNEAIREHGNAHSIVNDQPNNDEDVADDEDVITVHFITKDFPPRSISIHILQPICDVIADYRNKEIGFLRSTELTYNIHELYIGVDCTLTAFDLGINDGTEICVNVINTRDDDSDGGGGGGDDDSDGGGGGGGGNDDHDDHGGGGGGDDHGNGNDGDDMEEEEENNDNDDYSHIFRTSEEVLDEFKLTMNSISNHQDDDNESNDDNDSDDDNSVLSTVNISTGAVIDLAADKFTVECTTLVTPTNQSLRTRRKTNFYMEEFANDTSSRRKQSNHNDLPIAHQEVAHHSTPNRDDSSPTKSPEMKRH